MGRMEGKEQPYQCSAEAHCPPPTAQSAAVPRGSRWACPLSIRATQSTAATAIAGRQELRIGLVETATRVGRDQAGAGVVVLAWLPQQVTVLGTSSSPRRLCRAADRAEVAGCGTGPNVAAALQPAFLHLLPAVRKGKEGGGVGWALEAENWEKLEGLLPAQAQSLCSSGPHFQARPPHSHPLFGLHWHHPV